MPNPMPANLKSPRHLTSLVTGPSLPLLFLVMLFVMLAPRKLHAQAAAVGGCLYWFDDNDPNAADTLLFDPPAPIVDLDLTLPTDSLKPGLHTLHLRFFDTRNGQMRWTGVLSEIFVQPSHDAPTPNPLQRYRYWYDEKPEDIVEFPFLPEEKDKLLQLPLLTNELAVDTQQVNLQFRDARGQWSSVLSQSFFNSVRPVADFDLQGGVPCIGKPLRFESRTTFVSNFLWTFGDGDSSRAAQPSHIYDQPGTYTVTLRASNPLFKDSVVVVSKTYDIFVGELALYRPFGDTAVCSGKALIYFAEARGAGYAYTWLRDGQALDEANQPLYQTSATGRYQLVLRNASGCLDTSRASILTLVGPQTPVIRQGGGDTLIVEPGGLSYQWLVDGETIPEATDRLLRTHFDGVYSVRMIDSCGFVATSGTVEHSYVGRRAVSGNLPVWLYPNPSNGTSWLRVGRGDVQLQAIRVYDLSGSLRLERDLQQADASQPITLSGDNLPAGVYVVELRTAGGVYRLRWVRV